MKPSNAAVTAEFYRALDDADVGTLIELLHPDFRGEVTAGLPAGLGGSYTSPTEMLHLWARVANLFDIRPRPDEILAADGGRSVVLGHYVGISVADGTALDAAFVHVLAFRDGRIVSLRQVTDSARWEQALRSSPNVAAARRVMAAVVNREIEPFLQTYADDVEIREAPFLPYGGTYRGHEGMVAHGIGYVRAWDELQTEEDRDLEVVCFGSGDRVAAVWRQKATGPRGGRLDVPAISLFEFQAGKVKRLRMFYHDPDAISRFLGAEHATEPSTA